MSPRQRSIPGLLPTEARFDLGAAAATVEAGTGRILVMAQNKVFDDTGGCRRPVDASKTALNFNTDFPYGGSTGFQTGSTYKVFDLANWLQNGHGLNDLVNGTQPHDVRPSKLHRSVRPGASAIPGTPYKLQNDSGARRHHDREDGPHRLGQQRLHAHGAASDLCSIRDTAKSMGAHRADGKTDLTVNPAAILGTNEHRPLTMAGAVATIGAGGLHCTPIIVDKVVSPSGKDLPRPDQDLQPGADRGGRRRRGQRDDRKHDERHQQPG